jgi:hypothetical protein
MLEHNNNYEPDRVRANTAPEINQSIDKKIEKNVRYYSGQPREKIARRIRELDEEWDIERILQAMASSLSLSGIMLGATVDRRWFVLPSLVLSFLLVHAIQGWCPPIPLLRRLGIRTREEIGRERYALKALAGDFAGVEGNVGNIEQTLAAVK